MLQKKFLFIDRDGTLIDEPPDQQVDSLAKLKLMPQIIPALLLLRDQQYQFVMVSNQDGLGTDAFPNEHFLEVQEKLLALLDSQGITFSAIKICPHRASDNCDCRKPKLGLLNEYVKDLSWDRQHSYVIGDRVTDLALAANLGIKGILIDGATDWLSLANRLVTQPRYAMVERITKETQIRVSVNLDQADEIVVDTGLGFFNHLLEQLAKHGNFSLNLKMTGDLAVDEHHTIEDTALALGQVLREALGDKLGIQRYGFLLPMDEALTQIALDLSGRPYCVFEANFTREKVGDLPTELIHHFFISFAQTLLATVNIQVSGSNHHHMIESIFKGLGQVWKMAARREGKQLPTTKGVL